MLVSEPPYTGGTAQAVLGQILTGDPVWASKKRGSVPANVDAAIRKALEKLPADRFAGAQDFAKALADPGFRHGEPAAAGVAGGVGPWNRLSVATTALFVLASGVAAWSLVRLEPPQPVSRQVLGTEGWAGLVSEFGRRAAIAPDGSSMILPVGNQLALKLRGSTEITPIPGTELGRDVVYSPDGQWIAYAVGRDLLKRPLVGGSPNRLAEEVEPPPNRVAMAWLDDGTILYETASLSVTQIPEAGGELLAAESIGAMSPLVWMHGLPGARGALAVDNITDLHVVDLQDLSSELILEGVIRSLVRAHWPSGLRRNRRRGLRRALRSRCAQDYRWRDSTVQRGPG